MANGLFVSLKYFSEQYPFLSHFFVFLAAFLQGEIGIFLGLTFLTQKAIGLWGFITTISLGVLTADFLPYLIGRFSREKKFGQFLESRLPYREQLEYYFSKNLTFLIVLVKFLIGLNFAVMFLSGWSKINFKKFLKTVLLAFSLWFVFVSILGSFLITSLQYLKTAKIFKEMELGLAIIIVFVFVIEFLLKKIIFKKEEEIENWAKRFSEKILSFGKKFKNNKNNSH